MVLQGRYRLPRAGQTVFVDLDLNGVQDAPDPVRVTDVRVASIRLPASGRATIAWSTCCQRLDLGRQSFQ